MVEILLGSATTPITADCRASVQSRFVVFSDMFCKDVVDISSDTDILSSVLEIECVTQTSEGFSICFFIVAHSCTGCVKKSISVFDLLYHYNWTSSFTQIDFT